jgi:hypothetical protein
MNKNLLSNINPIFQLEEKPSLDFPNSILKFSNSHENSFSTMATLEPCYNEFSLFKTNTVIQLPMFIYTHHPRPKKYIGVCLDVDWLAQFPTICEYISDNAHRDALLAIQVPT